MKLKKGITLIILILTIILALILVTATTLAIGNSVENARLAAFANDLKEVKDAVKVYYMENDFFPTYADSMEALPQKEIFALVKNKVMFKQDLAVNNDYNENGDLGAFYKIDLKVLGIEQTIRGVKENGQEDDIYVVSYPSMQVYYLAGVKAKSNTYYSLSTRLTDVVKVVNAPTEYPDNDVQNAYGVTVKKMKKAWTNSLNVSIEAQMSATEGLYLKVQDGTEKKIATTAGQNIFRLDTLDKIYSQNTNTYVNTNIPASDITNFNNSVQDSKYIEIIKKDEEKAIVVGTIKVSLSNYETAIPVKASDSILTPGEEYNTVTFKAFDATSGVREVRYEYLKKFDERTTLPMWYYDGVTEYDPSYIKARGKKAELSEDGTVKIEIPKDIEGIEIRIFDRAGNVSDRILQGNKRDIWVGIEKVVFSSDMARFLFTFNSQTNIIEATAQISVDGKTYSNATPLSVPNVSNNIASVEATFIDITLQDTLYVKVSAKNGRGNTETRVKKFKVTGETTKDNLGKLMSYSQTIDGKSTGTYSNPIIPAGFAAINTTDSKWDTKTGPEYSKGLVIEDAIGNQFVWVPVDGMNVKYQKDLSYIQNIEYPFNVTGDEVPNSITSEATLINTYGGFYIGRYEAGVPEGQTKIDGLDKSTSDVEGMPVSKGNSKVWTSISYTNAKKNAEKVVATNVVQSGLLTGTQWDTAMQWLEKSGYNVRTDSKLWGNHYDSTFTYKNLSGSLITKSINNDIKIPTGSTEYTKSNNIYDLSGNMWEWNAEVTNNNFCTYRSGSSNYTAKEYPASSRSGYYVDTTYASLGFRIALYIKGTGEGTKNPSDLVGLTQAEKSKKPYIPMGFEWVSGTTVDSGYVIKGPDGSEFVWVPVDGVRVKYEKWCTIGNISYTQVFDVANNEYPTGITSATEKAIVNKAGGFYVGRYEAGVPDGQTVIDGTSTATSNVYGKPVSKKGAKPWTYIDYIRANGNAISYMNNTEITSGLLTGTSWDTIMRWLENSGYNVTDSRTWGNHNDSLAPANVSGYGSRQPTGYSDKWKVNNIYDLAGNTYEWTNELFSGGRVLRSGGYFDSGSSNPASYRGDDSVNATYNNLGFRVQLYIK